MSASRASRDWSLAAAREVVYDRSDGCRLGYGAMELGGSFSDVAMGALLGGPIGPGHGLEGKLAAERRLNRCRNPADGHTRRY